MNTDGSLRAALLRTIALVSLIIAGCGPVPATPTVPAPTAFSQPSEVTTPTSAPSPSPTADVLPALTWKPGDFYFSLNGKPSFIFSRNVAGLTKGGFEVEAEMAHQAGDLLVRVGVDNEAMGGYGYTSSGEIRETWSRNWEHFFDVAEANGLYVIPYFTGWANWNSTGFNTWATNPFNSANGGPAGSPTEFFKKDSPTQMLYLKWFKAVVTRWQKHRNILAWETITEVNYINGISQPEGVYLVEQLSKTVREADAQHRLITVSLADVGEWPDLYRSDAADLYNFHPYPPSARLDSYVLSRVRLFMTNYQKPVIIGESGLNAATPDTSTGKLTVAKNARIGIQHAIWAETVSGAMNGRALFWEDGYGVYFPALGMPFLQKYTDVEVPAGRFVNGVDMTGLAPINAQATGKIFGAALGNPDLIIGWYRDAACEPPDWNTQPVISNQTVTLTVPGSAANWKVDFYNTKTGTDILSSTLVARSGDTLTVPLPDFTDDIAFKMHAQP